MSMHRIGHVMELDSSHRVASAETIKKVKISGITKINGLPAYECDILQGFDARNKKVMKTVLHMSWVDRYYKRVSDA
jgi:hypothetical protein